MPRRAASDLFVSPLGSFSGKLCAQIRRLEQRGRKERETRDDAFVLVTGGTARALSIDLRLSM